MNPREVPDLVREHARPLHQLVTWPVDAIGMGIAAFTGGPSHVIQLLNGEKCFHFTEPCATFITLDEAIEGLKIETQKEQGLYTYARLMLVQHPNWHGLNMDFYEKLYAQCEKWNGTGYDEKELFVNHMRRRLGLELPDDLSNPLEWVCSSGIAHMWDVCNQRWPGFASYGYGPDDYLRNGIVVFDLNRW